MPSLEALCAHEEDIFDPEIHLDYSPAENVFSLADLGIEEHEYTTPIAGCTPFKLLSMEGVMAYRRALLRKEVFDECAGYPFPGTVTLRNVAKVSKFVFDVWTHPRTVSIISDALGIKVEAIMPTEIGHTNIQVSGPGDVLDQLSVQPSQEALPLTDEEEAYDPLSGSSVIPWHVDSYPYVCIVMLSDTTHMKGGETYISGKDIQAVSERTKSCQWSVYRLRKMRAEIDAALAEIDRTAQAGHTFIHQETENLCEELSKYAKRTARQMVDPEIRDDLARKYGAHGIANASNYWQTVRSVPQAEVMIADATKFAEDNMPRMKNYTLDWCQTRARIQRGSRERGTNGLIVWDEKVDYFLGDELEAQGLNEILFAENWANNPTQVKCDESKPTCTRCSKRQSSCTYGKKLEWRNNTAGRSKFIAKRAIADQSKDQAIHIPDSTFSEHLEPNDMVLGSLELPQFMNASTVLTELAQWDEQFASTSAIGMTAAPDDMACIYQMPGPPEITPLAWHEQSSTHFATDPVAEISVPTQYGSIPADFDLSTDRRNALMDFYFQKVAPIFSCYDGGKNPFHHLVAQVWYRSKQSSAEYLVSSIQSLAAVFHAKDEPSRCTEVFFLQRRTQEQLEQVPESQRHGSKYLFALVLLSISFMYSQDVPSSFKALEMLRDILQHEATEDTSRISQLQDRELRFFWGLQVYCEVFFACTDEFYCLPSIPMQILGAETKTRIYPHPFTGVANSISSALLEVIQLVRRQRKLARSHAFASRKYLDAIQSLMEEAAILEERVYTQAIPSIDDIEDPKDPLTPLEHLVKMAECNHQTALLQIYRVFPDVLVKRLRNSAGQDEMPVTDSTMERHCLSMAMHIIDTLSSIPNSSSTTPFQTVLLLSTSSELGLRSGSPSIISGSPPGTSLLDNLATACELPLSMDPDELERNLRISGAREFVVKRLYESQQFIPGDRLPKLLNIVQKVWALLDDNQRQETIYWYDVVMQ
ncbi:hypothetical protein E4T50_10149 [Aureobasidium sp. EXF-12298]|nr:hypothetical protein E4T50_10149 [Aureobasidium sp. EXF-12298]KAI4761194.1 hypothetical protein E4T51_05800 [Aureobasidium sp. EXF-12344]KAI4780141.1 hypothetical protein E4T52_04936 [Aureobasidium sp. EXF-3400]